MTSLSQEPALRQERADFSASRLGRASKLVRAAWSAAAFLCLSFSLVVILTLAQDFNDQLRAAQSRIETLTSVAAKGIALSLDGAAALTRAAAEQVSLKNRRENLTGYFFTRTAAQGVVDRVVFINPLGRITTSSLPDDPLIGEKIRLPASWHRTESPLLADYSETLGGVPMVLAVRSDDGVFLGVVAATLNRRVMDIVLRGEQKFGPAPIATLHTADHIVSQSAQGDKAKSAGAPYVRPHPVLLSPLSERTIPPIMSEKQVGYWPLWVELHIGYQDALQPFGTRLLLWLMLTLLLFLVVVMATRSHVGYVLRLYLQNAVIERQNVDLRATSAKLQKEATERAQAESQRDNFFNLSADMLAILDYDGRFLNVNPAFEETFETGAAELKGVELISFLHPDDVEEFLRALEGIDQGGAALTLELRCMTSHQQLRWFLWTLVAREGLIYAVAHDFTEHRKAADALKEAKEAAELASETKTHFLANMSHELRTPLNAIIGFSQALDLGIYGDLNDKQHEYVRDIEQAGAHLLSIVSDLLDLSIIDAGAMTLTETSTPLADIVQAALALVRTKAEEAGVPLKMELGTAETQVLKVDARKIRQILVNLISNALRFSPPEHPVIVRARLMPHDGGLELDVEDHGSGIKANDLPRVLSPFGQMKSAYARAHGGVGLGLPLARRLAELHDGTLTLSSEPDQGTTVQIWLPQSRLMGDLPKASPTA